MGYMKHLSIGFWVVFLLGSALSIKLLNDVGEYADLMDEANRVGRPIEEVSKVYGDDWYVAMYDKTNRNDLINVFRFEEKRERK